MRKTIRSAAIGFLNAALFFIALEIENGSDRVTGDQILAVMVPLAIVSGVFTALIGAAFSARS